jgi:ADP-ribosylglycohydrolase
MTLNEKVEGCLLASAIGNAMGSPVECLSYQEIEERHGRITDVLDASRLEYEDDNQIGLLLCKAYIEKQGPVISSDLARVWLRDMEADKFFWCMRNTYELLKQGVSPRLTGLHNIVTGSAIMAIAPVGIYHAFDPERAYLDAIDISYMYQPRQDVDAACVIAACVAEALKPNSSVDNIVNMALKLASRDKYIAWDNRKHDNLYDTIAEAIDIAGRCKDVFELRQPLYDNCLQWHAIDPTEVLTFTLAIFVAANGDTRQAIIGGVNTGRDTDTIANLNGALAGAMNGVDSVPREWIDKCSPHTIGVFKKTAADMTTLARKRIDAMKAQVEMLDALS